MLSAQLRVALDNLLPDAGEDEAYLGTPTLRDAAVLIAFTDRPDPGDSIYKDADDALYHTKENGRSSCSFFGEF